MLLGSMIPFPVGTSLKLASIGLVVGVVSLGGILAHHHYENLTARVTALNKANSVLTGETHSLKTVIGAQNASLHRLQGDITERDNRLMAFEASQKHLEQEMQQQQKESERATEQFKTLLADAQCANQRMPDDVIRLQHQRTAEFNRRYGG